MMTFDDHVTKGHINYIFQIIYVLILMIKMSRLEFYHLIFLTVIF